MLCRKNFYTNMYVYAQVCAAVCVRKREREKETEKEKERGGDCIYTYVSISRYVIKVFVKRTRCFRLGLFVHGFLILSMVEE